jgi:hypothetical protein
MTATVFLFATALLILAGMLARLSRPPWSVGMWFGVLVMAGSLALALPAMLLPFDWPPDLALFMLLSMLYLPGFIVTLASFAGEGVWSYLRGRRSSEPDLVPHDMDEVEDPTTP